MNDVLRRAPLVPRVDRAAPLDFLRRAYESDDWVAVLLKHYGTRETLQRVGPVAMFGQPTVQAWLRMMNAKRFNVYVSVNAVSPGRRSRTRDAVSSIRHVFVEVDHNGRGALAAINARHDLPAPSYVVHSSPDRLHVAEVPRSRARRRPGRDTMFTDHAATWFSEPQVHSASVGASTVRSVDAAPHAERFSDAAGCTTGDTESADASGRWIR
jgi:hypothetical protein